MFPADPSAPHGLSPKELGPRSAHPTVSSQDPPQGGSNPRPQGCTFLPQTGAGVGGRGFPEPAGPGRRGGSWFWEGRAGMTFPAALPWVRPAGLQDVWPKRQKQLEEEVI